ncbi:ABC transporter permease [Neomoorella humiferrea]|uniref:ABC transporter permease n=1 Tax=Neomoorella humiferrea TaxID=676965 RepID=UPI003D8C5D4D
MSNQLIRRLLHSKFFVCGGVIVCIVVLMAIVSPYLVVHNPELPNLQNRLRPPDFFSHGWSGYVLGTDAMGQDVLSRLLVGSRYSLIVAVSAVLVSALIGTAAGLIAGFYGGWVDNLIMRIGDIQLSIPALLLAIAIVAVLGPNLFNLIIVLIITSWVQYARVIRGSVLVIREQDFVAAARLMGGSDAWIMVTQILPNVLTPLLIVGSQQVGFMILMEAALSFLGLGVQPPTPSWGVMIADGREYISNAPWVVLAPGIALMITVLGFNFLGDGLRDVLDPKMKV